MSSGVTRTDKSNSEHRAGRHKGRHAHILQTLDLPAVSVWMKRFRVAELYRKESEAVKARVVFHGQGSLNLPKGNAAPEALTERREAIAGRGSSPTETLLRQYCVLEEGLPTAVNGRGIDFQRLISSYLCNIWGDRQVGRAPRGGLAYKLHRLNLNDC